MNQIDRTRLNGIFVTACIGITIITIILTTASICPSEFETSLNAFCDMIAWICVATLVLFIFMHTKCFKELSRNTKNPLYIAEVIGIFTALTLMAMYSGEFYGPELFKFPVAILMVAGLYGGPRIALPTTVICVVIDWFISPYLVSTGTWMEGILLVCGILVGIATCGRLPQQTILLIPPVAFLLYFFLGPEMLGWDFTDDVEQKIFYFSAAAMLISGYLTLALNDLLLTLMSRVDLATRSQKDLTMAHDIQMAAVPTEFPVSSSIDMYAMMTPAIEVGGDFYDCFTIGRNLTAFVMADVSDKGLPASLLMMRMMGSFKTAAMLSSDPGKVLTAVNKELCRNNPAEQFLTAWMGIYDRDTGILQYANAGHTPPYLKTSEGRFEKMEVKKGPIIGFSDAVRYKTSQITLGDGDMVFVYTDGVNEAFNTNEEEYGHERLSSALNSSEYGCAKDIIDCVTKSVAEFTQGHSASDDVTMLSFIAHRSQHRQISVPGKVEQLDCINEFIEETLVEAGCPRKDALKLQIVAEEIFVNICDHAYENREGEVTVICRYTNNEAKLTFCDDAEFFNPINKEDIEIDEDVGTWPIGGFGIHMVKKLVTYMDYKYFADKNIFTVWKRIEDRTEDE